MKDSSVWKADRSLGVVIVLVSALFNRLNDLIPHLERKTYSTLGILAIANGGDATAPTHFIDIGL